MTGESIAEVAAGLLRASGITGPVRVENHEDRIRFGTSQWSEVVTDRPGNRQIAHCADQEDADLIAHLINYLISQGADHDR